MFGSCRDRSRGLRQHPASPIRVSGGPIRGARSEGSRRAIRSAARRRFRRIPTPAARKNSAANKASANPMPNFTTLFQSVPECETSTVFNVPGAAS
jgi:hypothetical protein